MLPSSRYVLAGALGFTLAIGWGRLVLAVEPPSPTPGPTFPNPQPTPPTPAPVPHHESLCKASRIGNQYPSDGGFSGKPLVVSCWRCF